MIYIKIGTYRIPIMIMMLGLPCKTTYSNDSHISIKGVCVATLLYYVINKFCIWTTDDLLKFNYPICMGLSIFLVLYLEWQNFNSKWSGADKLYHGRFATIQSLISSGALYTAEYENFYIIEPRGNSWDYDKRIQIALPFHEYIRYYIFLIKKQKQDYKKKEAESDIAAANSIKKILSEYVAKNEDEANKYFIQSQEIIQNTQSKPKRKLDDLVAYNAGDIDWKYAVVEIDNPDSDSSDNKYSYFPTYTAAVLHVERRIKDEKIELYSYGYKTREVQSSDDIWDLSIHGNWGSATKYRWAIIKIKK